MGLIYYDVRKQLKHSNAYFNGALKNWRTFQTTTKQAWASENCRKLDCLTRGTYLIQTMTISKRQHLKIYKAMVIETHVNITMMIAKVIRQVRNKTSAYLVITSILANILEFKSGRCTAREL